MSIAKWKKSDELNRVLVVMAHPDDVDFGCAGTIAQLTKAGVEVAYCLVTSGDAGGDESTHTREERSAIREAEQTAAAAKVGVTNLTFLHWPDGMVEPSLELRRDISRVIRRTTPDVVICQNPERNWDRMFASHPDHMAAGEATVRAVYPDARNPHSFPELLREGLAPHAASAIWISGYPEPTMVVDITKVFDQKLDALVCHQSQVGSREEMEPRLREWATAQAKRAGLKKGHLAESFKVVTI
jgi:LmbE family N-acetylglucosaminyl deacetylase